MSTVKYPVGTVLCPVCGQPDNCGDCDHTPLSPDEIAELGGIVVTEEPNFKPGDLVRAFDPRTLGVVKHGRIIGIGPKLATIDFGFSGKTRVRREDILSKAYERANDG
jgi:hypothetical protein